MKVIAITGTHRATRRGEVTAYLEREKPDVVIAGDADGVDKEARAWAKGRALLIECHAPWQAPGKVPTGKSYWPGAGPFRNGAIAHILCSYLLDDVEGHVLRLAAFPDEVSRGTWDCVERSPAGVPVDYPGDPKWRAMAEARGLCP